LKFVGATQKSKITSKIKLMHKGPSNSELNANRSEIPRTLVDHMGNTTH